MSTTNVGDFLHRLTRGVAAELLGTESDRQLVERVLATRDESAILAIALRHGAMVYRVCRRVLRHPQDAEDAFQATFLVLALQLSALREHSSLAGWLHGVALRVSRKAKARATARQRWEAGAARPEAVPPDDPAWSEVRSVLDTELSRLPDKWRLPLILCYLEGRTQDEAADQLGWSKSTLRRRLERAREALGARLKSRGFVGSAAPPAVLASDSLAATAMSPACLDATVTAALAVVNGKPLALAASSRATVLAEGAFKPMFVKKIGIIAGAAIVLALVAAAAGGHLFAAHTAPTDVPSEGGPVPPVVLPPLLETTSARAEKSERKKDEPKREPAPITFKGHTAEVNRVCFSPDGKRLASAGLDHTVRVWDAEKGQELFALKGHTGEVRCVCFSPDGKRILTGGGPWGPKGDLKVWDTEKGAEILALKGHVGPVRCACFSPDGKRIASLGSDRTVRVWDAEKGQELLALKGEFVLSRDICFSPDGKRIATIMSPTHPTGQITLWDAEKGQELLTLKGKMKPGYSICFSPDGKRIAGVYPWNSEAKPVPAEITVWDTEKGQELLTLKGHPSEVFSVCFSPDGKRLASAGLDHTVRVWDADKGQELLTLKGHTADVRSVCFSPDGKRLASACADKTVKVWSLDQEK